MKIRKLFIVLLIFIAFASEAQVISMQAARNLGAGSTVTIRGIVTNGAELGTIRYMQDSTAGIAIYSSSLANVNRGDSIEITGTLVNYNQLLEMNPVTNFTVLSTGNASPIPEVITVDSLNENHESELVEIHNAVFTTNPGGTFSSNSSYNFTSNGVSSSIYVRSNHPLIGTVIPSGSVTLIGITSQYSYSSPNSGYQLLCRDSNDIVNNSAISIISTVSMDSLSTTGFVIDWVTDNAGTSEMYYGVTSNLGSHMGDTTAKVNHHLAISGATASQLYYVKAFSVLGNDTAFAPVRVFITQSVSSGNIITYFNTPTDHSVSTGVDAITLPNAIDDTLIEYINRAQSTIDFTMYNFNTSNISNVATALNSANARGVTVRVIYDNAANNTGIQQLDAAIKKISNPTGSQYGIMHNKFIVFDAYSTNANTPLVWTGSTNLTDGQINTDPNSVIIIQDKSLAISYTLEFNEMFGSATPNPSLTESKFGPDKMDNTPHKFIIGGKNVECYFSPSDGTNDIILAEIDSAVSSLDIATMLITRSDIAYAIQDAVNNNSVDAHILVNHENDCSQTVWGILSTLLDSNLQDDQSQPGIMHHKFMVVDRAQGDAATLVGSHNWSNAANDKNDENTLVIHDPTISNIYYQAFKYRFDQNLTDGISNNTVFTSVNLYPNPAQTQLNIEVVSQRATQARIEIIDLSGRVILYDSKTIVSGQNHIALNVSALSGGIYMIKMTSSEGIFMKKFMVN